MNPNADPWFQGKSYIAQRRAQLAMILYVFGSMIVLIMALDHVLCGSYLFALIDIVFAALLMISLFTVRFACLDKYVFGVSVAINLVVLILLSVQLPDSASGLMFWFFVFPLTAIMLTGKAVGCVWVFAGLLWLVFLLTDQYALRLFGYEFSCQYSIRFVATYFIIAIAAYLYEEFRERYEKTIDKLNKQLALQVQDKSEQLKKAEDNILVEERRFKELTERITDWIWEVDEKFRYTYSSPKVTDVLGHAPDSVIGHNFFTLMTDEYGVKLIDSLSDSIDQRLPITTVECAYAHSDGSSVILEMSAMPIFKADGSFAGYRGISRDITDRKEAEHSRQQLEEKLQHYEKMNAIGELANGMAHDFKNMITPIIGFAELIKTQLAGDDKMLQRCANGIYDAGQRCSDVINKLLIFSRKGKLKTVPVDMHVPITNALELFCHSIEQPIAVTSKLQAKETIVMGDATLLQNAILNILINARDAMHKGGELTVETDNVELSEQEAQEKSSEIHGGKYMRISITDNGIGMDGAVLRRIFEPFFTTKKTGQGTGLGLASVFGTVREHAGAIAVVSDVGQGATFTIWLPVKPPSNSGQSESPKRQN